jgi:hypothetical protein
MKPLLLILLVAAPWVVRAQFVFKNDNGALTIISYFGSESSVAVPSSTNGLPVTGISTCIPQPRDPDQHHNPQQYPEYWNRVVLELQQPDLDNGRPSQSIFFQWPAMDRPTRPFLPFPRALIFWNVLAAVMGVTLPAGLSVNVCNYLRDADIVRGRNISPDICGSNPAPSRNSSTKAACKVPWLEKLAPARTRLTIPAQPQSEDNADAHLNGLLLFPHAIWNLEPGVEEFIFPRMENNSDPGDRCCSSPLIAPDPVVWLGVERLKNI